MTTSSKTENSVSQPWAVQQPYLQSAFGQAAAANTNAQANTYNGQQVAQYTPDQLATFQKMIGYGGNTSIPDQTAAASGQLASAGTSALTTAMGNLNGYTPQGNAASNIADATAYANNPAIDGQIQGAMRDATRSVSEQQLPQIARQSAMSGNTMSSRRGVSEGIVQRGLADATADTSANIRGNAYNNGLQMAEQGRQANNSAMLNAMNGAAAAGGAAASTGINGLGSAISQQGGLFDMAQQGGAGQQAASQAGIDNEKAMTEYGNDQTWANLQQLYSIIGGQNWGGTKDTTSTSTPSLWSTIGSGLGLGKALLSDRRVKSDIKKIGSADNGLPIYSFRYTADPSKTTHVGFMAQDVEKVHPEAVTEINGLKRVDYEKASA